MALPKAIDFSNLSNEQIYNSASKQYKLLNQIPDDQWGSYCNKMLGKGVSVTYDAELDQFTAKPQRLKVKESIMQNQKQILLEQGDKVRFTDTNGEVIAGTVFWITEDNNVEVELTDGTITLYEYDLIANKGKKLYEANHRFKKGLTEDEKRSLLFDQDVEDDEELPEESTTEEDEIDSQITDDEEPDFDSEISSLTDHIDDDTDEEQVVDNSMNKLSGKGIESPQVVSMDDLEAVLKKILGNNTGSGENKEQYPNGEAAEVKENVPDLGKGPRPNVLETEFGSDTTLQQTDTLDTDVLKAMYGQSDGEVLDKEFAEIKDKISNVQNKIENQPSYQDFLNGDSVTPSAIEDDNDEIPDLYNQKNDGYGEDEEYLTDDSEFERNSTLSGGLGAYDTSDETGDMFEETGDIEQLPSVSANSLASTMDINDEEPLTDEKPVSVNKTVQCGGIPVQIVLTGVMLTMGDVSSIVESVKKKGLKVTKIESNKKRELNIMIESNGRKYKVHYTDVNAQRNHLPFSIKHEKFTSLIEACERIHTVSKQRINESDNFAKFNDDDILNRTINDPKDSTILTETKSNDSYTSAWNVRSIGTVNLKSGLNEAFSNIISQQNQLNTLIKTKDGQYYLLKGNLKERSKIGTIKELVDIQGKKSYGVGKVVGIYENSIKGLGRIMYHTKRTSLPLLIWK